MHEYHEHHRKQDDTDSVTCDVCLAHSGINEFMKNQAIINGRNDSDISSLQIEIKGLLVKVAGIVGGITAAGVFSTIIIEILKK